MDKKMTYADSGVDYNVLDEFKRLAQESGRETSGHLKRFGFWESEISRGESVYLIETPDYYLAQVMEGLGTKNLIADAILKAKIGEAINQARPYDAQIAQCAVAAIVNDMITLGALPLSVAMHLAVGRSDWFENKKRCRDLIDGWKNACLLARCAWGGGETSVLNDIVKPQTAVLSGSAIGIVKPKKNLMCGHKIRDDDAIILVKSSGIHANGLTAVRKIVKKLPIGYLTRMPNGQIFGEAILEPTIIYVSLIEECLRAGIDLHYAINITGHGWRKLMRAPHAFSYIVECIPEPHPIFQLIQKAGNMDNNEAYGTFNMGVGFALYAPRGEADRILTIAKKLAMDAFLGGYIKTNKEKNVLIKPIGLKYSAKTLQIR